MAGGTAAAYVAGVRAAARSRSAGGSATVDLLAEAAVPAGLDV